MVRVEIFLESLGENQVAALSLLRKMTGASLAQIKNSVGEDIPIHEGALFPRENPGFADELANTMESIQRTGGSLRVYLLGERHSERMELSSEVVRNMAGASAQELERQRDLAFSEAEEE